MTLTEQNRHHLLRTGGIDFGGVATEHL
ncbi:hypothetical protein A2U01_0072667, partial [Trifolium medium]|nr:hypothetical protein [Trifolium medium]